MKEKLGQKVKFKDSEPVCWQCFEDRDLQARIRSEGRLSTCRVCGGRRKSITILELGELMYPIMREQFVPGPYEHVFDGEDDDSGHQQQQGQTLYELIEEVLGQSVPFQDVLEAAIQYHDPADIRDGDEPYFSDAGLFVEREPYLGEHYERWQNAQQELRHQRRFFSKEAKDLFDEVFKDLEQRRGLLSEDEGVQPVLRTLPRGSMLFRARAFDSQDALREIISNPERELGAPPPNHARVGRMNADGVPVFYGALDPQTCISELRPPLRGDVAVGRFQTTRPMRLLDFRLLESGYWGLTSLSYFASGFSEEVERREFTRRLHRLIRAPILPGHEAEYLITQAMAEYLAHLRQPGLDGVIFESAQHEGGANVVLFPANFSGAGSEEHDSASRLLLFQADGLTLHRVTGVVYESRELRVFESTEGQIQIYDPHADRDDE